MLFKYESFEVDLGLLKVIGVSSLGGVGEHGAVALCVRLFLSEVVDADLVGRDIADGLV